MSAGCVIALSACSSRTNLPQPGTEAYTQVVTTFYVGLAALQVGDDVRAQDKLAELVKQAPGEPAGWGNWGVLALRQRNYDAAADRLQKAHDLAPKNDHIEYLQGLLESDRGMSSAAIEHLRKAVELNPQNLRAGYQLAEEVERQGGENSEAEVQSSIQKILAAHPDNLAALVELSRIAAKRADDSTLKSAVDRINKLSSDWPPEAQQQLAQLQSTIASAGPRAAGTRTVFLRNVLMRVPEYRLSLAALKAPPGDEAQPFTHFLRMESPSFEPRRSGHINFIRRRTASEWRIWPVELGWRSFAGNHGPGDGNRSRRAQSAPDDGTDSRVPRWGQYAAITRRHSRH